MYKAFDVRSALSLGIRIPPVTPRLVPQSSSEIVFTVLSISSLYCFYRVLKLLSKSSEDGPGETCKTTTDKCATQQLTETPALTDQEHPPSSSSKLGFFSSLSAMIITPRVPHPHTVPEPPTTRIERTQESPRLELSEAPFPEKQPYDAFLVLDVEATCQEGTDFNWPNEIIEWPVILMRWRSKDAQGRAKELYVADEFRSFVKPSWRPELSAFCTTLTGITQAEVDCAPSFPAVLDSFREFMAKNGLIDGISGERLQRFTWCTDGPFDIRDFVVKQCFISKLQMPEWIKGDVLDVRKVVSYYLALQESGKRQTKIVFPKPAPRRRTLNISQQLRVLSLPDFVGRQHSGIDDTRNIARIVTELAKRGIRLEPNTQIFPGRRWQWMGRPGQVLEEYCSF